MQVFESHRDKKLKFLFKTLYKIVASHSIWPNFKVGKKFSHFYSSSMWGVLQNSLFGYLARVEGSKAAKIIWFRWFFPFTNRVKAKIFQKFTNVKMKTKPSKILKRSVILSHVIWKVFLQTENPLGLKYILSCKFLNIFQINQSAVFSPMKGPWRWALNTHAK